MLNKQIEDGKMSEAKALLDVLLMSTIDGKPMSNEAIREEIDTFSFAGSCINFKRTFKCVIKIPGHDTTSCAIAYCLFNIAKHPEVQQKSYEEVMNVLGDVDREITMNDLNELNYLELVIKESLRLFPPVPIIGRKLLKDIDLSTNIERRNNKSTE